jgi:branched-chain amino acid transport system permease protein
MGSGQLIQYLLSGVTTGSVYAIIGIGFNIIYNSTGIINFAQGEFLMLGGMISVSLAHLMPLAPAVALAVLATGLIGVLLQLVFISWLKSPSVLRMIIITIGLSILVREAALHVWDEKVHSLPFFSGDETTSIALLGARISPQVLWILGISAVMVAGLTLFFRSTLVGKAMRACASNGTAARLCGIRTSTLVTLSFFIAAAMGALAGCAVSPMTQTQYDMGASLAVKGFTCAVLGGLGNITAAVAAGLLIGVLEAFSISVLPLAFKDVVALTIMLAILFFRPEGLFGKKQPGLLGTRAPRTAR